MDENQAPAGEQQPAPQGFFATLVNVYFSPGEAFRAIVSRPAFLAPLVLWLGLSAGFTGIWMQKVDRREFIKNQIEAAGRWDQIPADRRDAVLTQQSKLFGVFAWLGSLVFAPLGWLIISAALLFVFRFFYGSDVSFRQALSICAWTFAAVALLSTPLILTVLSMKGDWNINPQEALQANLTLLLDKATTAKWLYSLASSLDLFSFWMIFLIASGFGAVSRKGAAWAAAGVLVPWALFVLVKVGFAAIF
jgi:Yip1 domain